MTSTTLAATIRAEIARADRTQTDIAELLGISQGQVSARMRGAIDWRITELTAISTYLDIPLTTLLAEAPALAESSQGGVA